MKQPVILDTGPLVALLNKREHYHAWAVEQFAQIAAPLLTCEAVITEATFLLRHVHGGQESVLRSVAQGLLTIPFRLIDNTAHVQQAMQRFASVPMSFADACLLEMAERYPEAKVLTLDSDFHIYRKDKNKAVAVLTPF